VGCRYVRYLHSRKPRSGRDKSHYLTIIEMQRARFPTVAGMLSKQFVLESVRFSRVRFDQCPSKRLEDTPGFAG